MDGAVILIGLSIAMFIGSYAAGILPLIVPFSEARLRLITVLGAGLLVGTALAVIIPEGVQSIYSAAENTAVSHPNPHEHHQHQDNQLIPAVVVDPEKLDTILPSSQTAKNKSDQHQAKKKEVGNALDDGQIENQHSKDQVKRAKRLPLPLAGIETRTRKKRDGGIQKRQSKDAGVAAVERSSDQAAADVDFPDHHEDSHQHSTSTGHSHKSDVHGTVGIALVAGFVLMLLVDQLAQRRSGRDVDLGGGALQPRYKITATIGLVVHAAADGVALGAASGSSHAEIQLIVFLAIMLHKAPASFGLVTFLLHEGLDKARIRRHLLIFALAAPVAAILTYVFISHGGNKETLTSMNTTGILLLFSAGTFLYVATVHVLPEVAAGGHHHSGGGGHSASGFKLNELIALVFGAVAPTFLTLGHSH